MVTLSMVTLSTVNCHVASNSILLSKMVAFSAAFDCDLNGGVIFIFSQNFNSDFKASDRRERRCSYIVNCRLI